MTQDVTYDGSPLTIVRLDDAVGAPEWVEAADHGRIGDGSMTIDDVAGTQLIRGHKTVTVEEDECAVPRTLTAVIGQKTIRRGSGKTEASRIIRAVLFDLNARLSFRFIHGTGSRRPKGETVGERVDWILGDDSLTGLVADLGFVAHPTTELDEADYRGRFPEDVLTDMATEVGFNFFAYWDPDEADVGLWFADSNTSTDFTSSLRFSNVLSDVDDSTTFRLGSDSELEQDPTQVISQGWMPYARGNVIRTRAATEDVFPRRGGVAPSSDVKRRVNARRRLDRYLFARRNEEDTFTEEVELPAEKINLVRAGQRVQVRHSYAVPEGYGEFSWFRITETRKKPLIAPDQGLYKVTMTLSPQEPATTCAYIVQSATNDDDPVSITLPSAVTPGNVLVAIGARLTTSGVPTLTGFSDLGTPKADAGSDGGQSRVFAQAMTAVSTSAGPFGGTEFTDGAVYKWRLYEIGSTSLAGLDVLTVENGTPGGSSATLDAGDFVAASGVVLMIQLVAKQTGHGALCNGPFPCVNPGFVSMGTGWIERFDGDLAPTNFPPYIAIGDFVADNETVAASWDWGPGIGGDVGPWAAIAVLANCP